MFPALVTCCYIDWFHAWPVDALHAVATAVLREDSALDGGVLPKAVNSCVQLHVQAEGLARAFCADLGRSYQVTPSLFLRMLSTYAGMLSQVWSSL
jgi:dynein heavy chain